MFVLMCFYCLFGIPISVYRNVKQIYQFIYPLPLNNIIQIKKVAIEYVPYRYSVNSTIFLISQIGLTDSNSLRRQSNFEVCQLKPKLKSHFRNFFLTECQAQPFMKILSKVFSVVPMI